MGNDLTTNDPGLLVNVAAFAALGSAFLIAYMAKAITPGAKWRGHVGLFMKAQQLAIYALAVALCYYFKSLAEDGHVPSVPEVLVFAAFFVVLMISAARHHLGPRLRSEKSWRRGLPAR